MYRCIFFILLLAGGKWAAASQTPPILADEAIRQMLSTRIDLQKHIQAAVVGETSWDGVPEPLRRWVGKDCISARSTRTGRDE